LKSRAAEAGSPSSPGHNHQLPKSKLIQGILSLGFVPGADSGGGGRDVRPPRPIC